MTTTPTSKIKGVKCIENIEVFQFLAATVKMILILWMHRQLKKSGKDQHHKLLKKWLLQRIKNRGFTIGKIIWIWKDFFEKSFPYIAKRTVELYGFNLLQLYFQAQVSTFSCAIPLSAQIRINAFHCSGEFREEEKTWQGLA